jgi:peptide chain release factor subunit 1
MYLNYPKYKKHPYNFYHKGGENGFNQAIDLASEFLKNLKFVQEKKLIEQFFEEIAKDSGLFCFGVDETLRALESSAVQTLIVWEDLEFFRYTLKSSVDATKKILHFKENDEKKNEVIFFFITKNKFFLKLTFNIISESI